MAKHGLPQALYVDHDSITTEINRETSVEEALRGLAAADAVWPGHEGTGRADPFGEQSAGQGSGGTSSWRDAGSADQSDALKKVNDMVAANRLLEGGFRATEKRRSS